MANRAFAARDAKGITLMRESSLASALVWSDGRVFVTPAFGCPARCGFCYLPDAGTNKPTRPSSSGEQLFLQLVKDGRFVGGSQGTVLSMGCLSDPLAPHALDSSIEFVAAASSSANPIQIATRWVLPPTRIDRVLSVVRAARAVIFHSFSTMTSLSNFEPGTPSLSRRLSFMRDCAREQIPSVLYIKPFIPGVTIKDVTAFCDLAQSLAMPCAVVGGLYSNPRIIKVLSSRLQAESFEHQYPLHVFPVSATPSEMINLPHPDVQSLVRALTKSGVAVFQHSLEALAFMRELSRGHYEPT